MKAHSLRARIIALLVALALPLIAIGAFAFISEYRTSAERAEGAAVELAVATANGVSQILDDAHSILDRLSLDSTILALDARRCAPWLQAVTSMLPQFANIVVADSTGIVVCSGMETQERPDVSGRSWFIDVMRTGRQSIGHYQLGSITGRAVVVASHPLLDPDGSVRGVVAAGIDLQRFQDLLSGLPLPPGSVITLADATWTVLGRSQDPERWVGQTLPGDTVPEREVAPGIGIFKAVGLEGTPRVFGFANIHAANWRVYAGVPQSWIYAPVRASLIRRSVAAAVVLLAVAVLTWLLFRRVAHSLALLVSGTRAAAEGEGARVPEVGPTEVVEVARQFNATLAARDRAEEELRRARERYASILRNAVSGIFVATIDGRFLEVNNALVHMLGYPSETALRSVSARVPFQNPESFDMLARRALQGERLQGEEVEWHSFDGQRVIARLSCGLAVTTEGDRVLEVIAEDVTERRALEEHLLQTRKMEAIGRLAGGVAHDFNNLLTIVRGQAQFLLMELDENAELRQHADEIVEATKRGARLTRQLLAFGRRQLVQPIPLDLNEVVRGLRTMLRRVVGDDIEVVMSLPPDLPPAHADPGQVEQIVMNLVFNARDAMPRGGRLHLETGAVTLREGDCRGRAGCRPGDFIRLTVSDTGDGIPADVIGRVFEPFFTTKPQGQGTGLGLATVYGIVNQCGGWIEVESRSGEGAKFKVHLPRAAHAPVVVESQIQHSAPPDGQGTLLVVEDEEAVRRVVVGGLRQHGYTVLEAGSGEDALQVCAGTDATIDALVTDEMMPGMRGTQLAATLLPRRPGMRVLFMSGYTDRMPTGRTFAGAPAAFIGKPFSHEQLADAVARLLQREAVAAESP